MTEKRIRQLLLNLCVKFGFCLSPAAQAAIIKNPPKSAIAFTNAVYQSEGLDPGLKSNLYKLVYTHVAQAFEDAEEADE